MKKTIVMNPCHIICWIVSVAIVIPRLQASPHSALFGLQAGDGASSSFAVSMIYNERNHEIAVTGGTFGNYFQPQQEDVDADMEMTLHNKTSDCFVAILRLPHVDAKGHMTDPNQVSWVRRRQYGTTLAHETCTDLIWNSGISGTTTTNLAKKSMIAIGHSAGPDGLLTSLLPYGNEHRQVYGTVLCLDSAVELQGGVLLHSNQVQLPMAITQHPLSKEVFIAETFSEHSSPDSSTVGRIALGYDGSEDLSKDSGFSVRIRKLVPASSPPPNDENVDTNPARSSMATGNANSTTSSPDQLFEEPALVSSWTREFGTMGLENVLVSSLTWIPDDKLVMTGYTAGSSMAFGETAHCDKKGIVDSFVTVLDPGTGEVLRVLRMEADGNFGNNRAMGLCHQQQSTTTPSATSEVYLVGTTEQIDQSSSFSFLQKVNLETKQILWRREIRGSSGEAEQDGPHVHGMACTVTSDGKDVYMAGNVIAGTILSLESPNRNLLASAHGDNATGDIFIAKFDTAEGTLAFSRQIGSLGKDTLASGKSLATDSDGNVIVLANTEGSLFLPKIPDGSSDIVVFSIDREKGEFFMPHSKSSEPGIFLDKSRAGSRTESPDKYDKWIIATYVAVTLLAVILLTVGAIHWKRCVRCYIRCYGSERSEETVPFGSSRHVYEGIWRTAECEPGTAGHDRLMLVAGGATLREAGDLEMNDSPTRSATKFPLGSYARKDGQKEKAYGDVYDLLAVASERYSKVVEDDNARSRSRLADAVRSMSGTDDDIPDISKISRT